jgi:hypothetical protein
MSEQVGRYRGRGRVAAWPRGREAVAARPWDTVETVHRTYAYAHLMPGADDRGRKAMDEFFKRAGDKGSAQDVPSDEAG